MPVLYSYRTGHFLSSFKVMAVSRHGKPIPWYTYPAIDFLKYREYEGKTVLEFGGGQSTLWWAQRADHVTTFEGDKAWYDKIKQCLPENAEIHLVPMESAPACVGKVEEILKSKPSRQYDVIIIDGLYRYQMIEIALKYMSKTGIIIYDNAEGGGVYERFKNSDLKRVDLFGNAPGVALPHCTSIYFRPSSFVFDLEHPIPVIAVEKE